MGGAAAPCRVVASLFLLLALLAPVTAAAGAAPADARILTLGELLPSLRAAHGAALTCALPPDTPLLLPEGADPGSPKTLEFALLNAGLVLREEPGALRVERAPGPDERAQALGRLRPVSPQRPAPGPDLIPRGVAILQGRFVEPPFRVEASAEAVLVNGVVVYPSPGEAQASPTPSPAQVADYTARLAAFRSYRNEREERGEAAARAALMERMLALPDVRAARWVDRGLQLSMADGSEETIHLAARARAPEPPTPAAIAAEMEAEAATIRSVLTEGGTLIAGSTYLLTISDPGATALRGRAEAILASGDDETLKRLRLQALLGHRHAAADLLYARQGGTP
jgi:hypothetical protein